LPLRIHSPFHPNTPLCCHTRTFTTTPSLQKKKDKPSKSRESDSSSSSSSSKSPTPSSSTTTTNDDPFDFSELETALARAHDRLKDDLSKLRAGGRFNPELVENLRVSLDKNSKETFKLGDLAQVVPRGRVLNLIAGDGDVCYDTFTFTPIA